MLQKNSGLNASMPPTELTCSAVYIFFKSGLDLVTIIQSFWMWQRSQKEFIPEYFMNFFLCVSGCYSPNLACRTFPEHHLWNRETRDCQWISHWLTGGLFLCFVIIFIWISLFAHLCVSFSSRLHRCWLFNSAAAASICPHRSYGKSICMFFAEHIAWYCICLMG